jgi:isocitrate lyase
MNEPNDPYTGLSDTARWVGIKRAYSTTDVLRLRGSLEIEYTIARKGAERLWDLLHTEPYVAALGAMTGNQAIEQVRAGLSAIYASGLQTSVRLARELYSDQRLFPLESVPNLVRHINSSLQRADQIHHAEGNDRIHWFAPVVADATGCLGNTLSVFELMKAMIEAGAAAVHFEEVLPHANHSDAREENALATAQLFVEKLTAARLAADVMNVPTLLIACINCSTWQNASDSTEVLRGALPDSCCQAGSRLDAAIARALVLAPYADVLCWDNANPDLKAAGRFAEAIHQRIPGKLLAYDCPPTFNWFEQLDTTTVRNFHVALSGMGYKLQFITLAGFHCLNLSMFDFARDYRETGMAAYARLQANEFQLAASHGYEALRHRQFVGGGYFGDVAATISAGLSRTKLLATSPQEREVIMPEFHASGQKDPKTAPSVRRNRTNSS